MLGQKLHDDVADLARTLGIDRIRMVGHDLRVTLVQLLDAVHWKRHSFHKHHIHRDTQRVLISLGIYTFTAHNLGRHKHRGYLLTYGLIKKFKQDAATVEGEVSDLHSSPAGEEHIGGLEIVMHEALVVEVLKAVADLRDNRDADVPRAGGDQI